MRRVLDALAFALAAVVISAGPALADYGPDCDDFSSAQAAQDYYESQGGVAGGDPDGLDRDQDGQACDWGAPPPDIDWSDSSDGDYTPGGTARISDSGGTVPGLPWWAWAGGGIAALWVVAAVRWNT